VHWLSSAVILVEVDKPGFIAHPTAMEVQEESGPKVVAVAVRPEGHDARTYVPVAAVAIVPANPEVEVSNVLPTNVNPFTDWPLALKAPATPAHP